MRYQIKALNTRNRDLRTALLLSINYHSSNNNYLFSCPDGFQRIANSQKMRFGKVQYIFLPSLKPDYFAGFPGFYLSARESQSEPTAEQSAYKIVVVGPQGLKQAIQRAIPFVGNYRKHL